MTKTYLTILFIPRRLSLKVGSLGELNLEKGYYLYIGSGGRNIYKRISRHFRLAKKRKWHIDYITNIYPAIDAFIVSGVDEYALSQYFYKKGLKFIPKFGATDKKSVSHLYYLNNKSQVEDIIMELKKSYNIMEVNYSQLHI